MGNFYKDLKTGEIGESVVLETLIKINGVEDILDVRDIKEWQQMDVDFLVFTNNNILIPIEVKTDNLAHSTGNIAYEVLSNKHYNTKGCFEKTRAKYIYYYLTNTEKLYQIDVKRLRSHVKANYKGKKKMIAMGDNAEGYLIKINELIKNGVMKEVLINDKTI